MAEPTRDTEHTPRDFGDVPDENEYAAHATNQRQHTIDTARGLVRADWLITHTGDRLHYAVLSDEQALAIDAEQQVLGNVTLVCGQQVAWVAIPDFLTRMALHRCDDCCDAIGLPRGKGSPKNDHACREVLGLDGGAQ